MKRLLTTTALVAMTALPLSAEQHSSAGPQSEMSVQVGEQEIRVSNLMNAKVYMPNDDASGNMGDMKITDEALKDWTEIGTVNDVFVDESGRVSTVVLSPNGEIASDADMLGLNMQNVTLKTSEDGEQQIVAYTGDKVMLENSESFDQAQAEEDGMMSAKDQQMAGSDSDQMNNTNDNNNTQMADAQNAEMQTNGLTIRAADLTGHSVYVPGESSAGDEIPMEISGLDDQWERVGEIGSVILSREGDIKSVTLDAGGFLGINEKEVETSMEELRFVRDSDSDADNEWFIVFTGDRSSLEQREEYDEAASNEAGERRMTDDETAVASNNRQSDAAQGDDTETQMLAAEELDGAPVYDASGEEIGNISELLVDDSGQVSEVVIDVGGFLGLGEKPVAISYTDLMIDESVNTTFGDVRVSLAQTRQELENMDRWVE
ncbi:MAG: PRC-barrel domain-containing protein [Pelagibaca sp.]